MCGRSRGFVYGVDLLGVTGERPSLADLGGARPAAEAAHRPAGARRGRRVDARSRPGLCGRRTGWSWRPRSCACASTAPPPRSSSSPRSLARPRPQPPSGRLSSQPEVLVEEGDGAVPRQRRRPPVRARTGRPRRTSGRCPGTGGRWCRGRGGGGRPPAARGRPRRRTGPSRRSARGRRTGLGEVDVLPSVEHDRGADLVGHAATATGRGTRPSRSRRSRPVRPGGRQVAQRLQARGLTRWASSLASAACRSASASSTSSGRAPERRSGASTDEPLRGQPVAHVPDERRQPPPGVEQEHPGTLAGGGRARYPVPARRGGLLLHAGYRTVAGREPTTATCARRRGSRTGSTRTTSAGSPSARSATRRWSCGAGTAPTATGPAPTCTPSWPGRRRRLRRPLVDDTSPQHPDHSTPTHAATPGPGPGDRFGLGKGQSASTKPWRASSFHGGRARSPGRQGFPSASGAGRPPALTALVPSLRGLGQLLRAYGQPEAVVRLELAITVHFADGRRPTECALRGVKSCPQGPNSPPNRTIDHTRAVKAGGRQPVARSGSLDGPDTARRHHGRGSPPGLPGRAPTLHDSDLQPPQPHPFDRVVGALLAGPGAARSRVGRMFSRRFGPLIVRPDAAGRRRRVVVGQRREAVEERGRVAGTPCPAA